MAKYDREEFALRIRERRKREGLSLKQLGEKIGVAHNTLQRIETSPKATPIVTTFEKIMDWLDSPIAVVGDQFGITQHDVRIDDLANTHIGGSINNAFEYGK